MGGGVPVAGREDGRVGVVQLADAAEWSGAEQGEHVGQVEGGAQGQTSATCLVATGATCLLDDRVAWRLAEGGLQGSPGSFPGTTR